MIQKLFGEQKIFSSREVPSSNLEKGSTLNRPITLLGRTLTGLRLRLLENALKKPPKNT